ncbi:tigger transposable element-derived protein 1-like [Montipora capricornis]|uniref:tigger transposable element-derived protein 1-like n=1 Tax=Montipora capricornis TaxID=246305 RepID=UPI0035F1FB06
MACCGNGIPERASNIPVDDPILVEEARIIAERFGEDTFKGTSGWLETWKKRHNIGQMSIAGEEGDVSPVTTDSWNERVKELTKGYSPRDVWNEDETGCFWKAMPEKSLSQKGKRCMQKWLNNSLKREERHTILSLDNAMCHPPSLTDMFSNIKVAFLQKNTTSRTQPVDAGIIKQWKVYYKRKLLRHIVSQFDGEHSASQIEKSENLLMAVRWMVNTWDEVKGDVISK